MRFIVRKIRQILDSMLRSREPFRTRWLLEQYLVRQPKNVPGQVKIGKWTLEYVDARSLASMYKLQVLSGYNDFWSAKPDPIIIDCGSNIGLSVLRYKSLYPQARITAFEPDPLLCQKLRSNLQRNGCADVEVVEAAVWTKQGELQFQSFYKDDSQSGRLQIDGANPTNSANTNTYSVKTVGLGDYLDKPVDFIKLDAEAAELPILQSCTSLLCNVDQMQVEVHYRVDAPIDLSEILRILHDTGFMVAINQHFSIKFSRPFKRNQQAIADQFPVLCAWRGSLS